MLECAHHLADVSARVIRPYFRTALSIEDKNDGDTADQASASASASAAVPTEHPNAASTVSKPASYLDPVTVADRAAEQAIRDGIGARYPDHGIIGEEFGTTPGAGRYSWVIDPIDGTRAFIMGYPTWGTLIGLLDGDDAILGIMNQPFTGERFWADGNASYCRIGDGDARKLTTRPCASLGDAVFATTDPALFAAGFETDCFEAVKQRVAMTRFGGDCYAYCMLSSGLVDVVLESNLKPHDIVALIPIVESAGGRITSWDGGTAIHGDRILATGDARLHDKMLELLAGISAGA